MREVLAVGLGGFLGALARYGLASLAHRVLGAGFPVGTLAVNLVGCAAMGALAWFVEERELGSPELRLFARVGFLGSLTTFSAFGHETVLLLRQEQWLHAGLNVGLNVAAGLLAVIGGWAAARWLAA